MRGPTLSHVVHGPETFDPTAGEAATVRFQLSESAVVRLHIYDGRDLNVRSLGSSSPLEPGENGIVWDGRDFAGRVVPAEAYVYTLEATNPSGERSVWDPTDVTVGELRAVPDVSWDSDEGVIEYRLRRPSRVRLRIGLDDHGPMLRTLIDWVPRGRGPQREAWGGRDASGILEIADRTPVKFNLESFALSKNTLLVGPAPDEVRLIGDLPESAARRVRSHEPRKRMYDYPRQPIETRRDFSLRIDLPASLEKTAEGVPIVSGPVPVRISVDERDLARVVNQRAEAMFFVDGRYVFENEAGFLPMAWTWSPEVGLEGIHFITANLVGYEGHVGTATVKVFVARPGMSD